MAAWERVQTDSEALQPVLNVMYLQLQLLQGVQESVEVREGAGIVGVASPVPVPLVRCRHVVVWES